VESVLSIIIRNHGCQDILEEIKWENVENVEQLFHRLERSGTMIGGQSKAGKRTQLEIGLFGCQKCKKPFREVLSKKIILTLPEGDILRFAKKAFGPVKVLKT
jgi:hypothetical protein